MAKTTDITTHQYEVSQDVYEQIQFICRHYGKPAREKALIDKPLARAALRAALYQNPEHPTDHKGRLAALQQAIDYCMQQLENLDLLTQAGKIYVCLYSHTYKRDLRTGILRTSKIDEHIAEVYGISVPYYHRLRDEGLKQLGYHFCIYLVRHTTLLEPIPQTRFFIGRTNELSHYRAYLEQNNITVIQGVDGIGKTTLAAHLLQTVDRPVCWFTLRSGLNNNLVALLYTWAAFLAQHDQHRLWALMQTAASPDLRATGFNPEVLADMSALLCIELKKIQPILCLDNLETISETDDGFWSLLEQVAKELDIRLICTTQERPSRLRLGDYPLLKGLSPDEVQRFLAHSDIHLSSAQAEALTSYTSGNPRILELWVASQRVSPNSDIAVSLQQLPQTSVAVQEYLTQGIMNGLSTSEQQAARLLSLSRIPLDASIVLEPPDEKPFDQAGITDSDDFEALHNYGLIHEETAGMWSLSPIVRDYLQFQMSHEQTQGILLHRCLEYIHAMQGSIESAYHALQSGDKEKAVRMLYNERYLRINQGLAPAVLDIAKLVHPDNLDASTRQCWHELKSEVSQILGHYEEAENEARAALNEATTPMAQSSASQHLGAIEEVRGDIVQAGVYYQQALQLLESNTREAWLRRDLAWIQLEQGDIEQAWQEIERANIALANISGDIARREGKYELARTHFQQAIDCARRAGERHLLAKAVNNMAILHSNNGNHEAAIDTFREYLQIAEEIGELRSRSMALYNIGVDYYMLEEFDSAIDYASKGLQIYEDIGDHKGQILAHSMLGESYLAIGNIDDARLHTEAAIAKDVAESLLVDYAEALRVHAEVLLAFNETDAAKTTALRAHTLIMGNNEEPIEPFTAAYIFDTLSRIHVASQEPEEAKRLQDLATQIRVTLSS